MEFILLEAEQFLVLQLQILALPKLLQPDCSPASRTA